MSRGLKLEKLKLTNTKEALLKSDQMVSASPLAPTVTPIRTFYNYRRLAEKQRNDNNMAYRYCLFILFLLFYFLAPLGIIILSDCGRVK